MKFGKCVLSKDGLIYLDGSFADLKGTRSPCNFSYVSSDLQGEKICVEPSVAAFSSFVSKKTATQSERVVGTRKEREVGSHVGLAYNNVSSFFALLVLRCDTWAVQWAVSRSGCLEDAVISHFVAPNAHILCGVCARSGEKNRLFVASRIDVPRVSKTENREWRSFMAAPRLLETSFEGEGIATVVAAEYDSIFVLTDKGNIYLLALNLSSAAAFQKSVVQKTQLVAKIAHKKGSTKLVVSSNTESCLLVAYSEGANSFEVLNVEKPMREGEGEAPAHTVRTQSAVHCVEFAGSFHIVATLSNAALQFVSIIPGNDGAIDTTVSSPLPLKALPVATFFNAAEETHTIICPSATSQKGATSRSEEDSVKGLVSCTLSLRKGPYSASELRAAMWTPVMNPFCHYGPRSGAYLDTQDGDEGLKDDIQTLRLTTTTATQEGRGRWVPLQLHYALATQANGSPNVAVFSVITAPHIHTRLIKQWHNATVGLQMVLNPRSSILTSSFALPWNPRHVRRALRLMSQQQLSAIFKQVTAALRSGKDSVIYCEAATASVGIALHIITLSGQTGVVLNNDDVEVIALLLRASRETGHELLRCSARMELLMESCLQQRAMNRLLTRQPRAADEAEEESGVSVLHGGFFGIPTEVQTERTLRTRYTANTWTQRLEENKAHYVGVAQSAAKYLAQAQIGDDAVRVCDWDAVGRRPHKDAILNVFESTLVKM